MRACVRVPAGTLVHRTARRLLPVGNADGVHQAGPVTRARARQRGRGQGFVTKAMSPTVGRVARRPGRPVDHRAIVETASLARVSGGQSPAYPTCRTYGPIGAHPPRKDPRTMATISTSGPVVSIHDDRGREVYQFDGEAWLPGWYDAGQDVVLGMATAGGHPAVVAAAAAILDIRATA